MTITKYDPEKWLETAVRGIRDYAEEGFHNAVLDDTFQPVGNQVYEIVMEYPSTELITRLIPLNRTIIHFEIDEIDDRILGFGDGYFRVNYNEALAQIEPQEAGEHRINFDVGIWASDRTGGTTARLRAYQILRNLFQGPLAIEALRQATDNDDGRVEIIEFTGGRFFPDEVNDIPIHRMLNCSMTVRVFSRTPKVEIPAIEEITQIPELVIDENLQLPMGVVIKDAGTSTENAIVT
jgi:hypothetical protein